MAFSYLACAEILDGTKGLPASLCRLKVVLVAGALTAVFMSYSSVRGVEAGISLLVVLLSLKILEAHTAREFRVMILIGWILCLCGFLLSQDFAIALSLLAAFALLVVALIQFHRGAAPRPVLSPLRTMGKLLLQAAPLVVFFFLLFPRVNTGFGFELRFLRSPNTGFSDRLSPGSIAALANSSEIAFRAEFPGSNTRPTGPMYWRGIVMWRCNGLEWRSRRTCRGRNLQFPRQTSRTATVSQVNRRRRTKSNSASR